jgi:hypothetical protein
LRRRLGRKFFAAGAIFFSFHVPTPGSGGEERSDEVPEPGVGTWFARPL